MRLALFPLLALGSLLGACGENDVNPPDQPAAPLLAGTGITLDARITIAMLLDHTSGIGDYLVNPKIEAPWAAAPDARWTPAQDWAYQTKAVFPPGGGFYYSNANYLEIGRAHV